MMTINQAGLMTNRLQLTQPSAAGLKARKSPRLTRRCGAVSLAPLRANRRYHYDVFGNNYTGSLAGSNSLGYAGKRYDPATSFYDYGFRDYDSTTGRFTTVDPIRDGYNWYAYCNNDPVIFFDLWGLKPAQDKPYSLDAYEYQLRTNNGLLKQAVEELAHKGQDIIPYSSLLDNNGKSATARFANALTSEAGLSVLQDSTRAYVTNLSRTELVDSLNKANLVTGIDMNDVSNEIDRLNRMGVNVQFDPTKRDAFSISGYVFTSENTNSIVSQKEIGNQTYYMINDEETMRLLYHEDTHYQSALATGNEYQWFENYNNEFQKNLANGMSKDKAYYSLSDEREAYSFGPYNSEAETNFNDPKTGDKYIKW